MRSARSNRLGFCWKSGIVARTVMAWLTGAAGLRSSSTDAASCRSTPRSNANGRTSPDTSESWALVRLPVPGEKYVQGFADQMRREISRRDHRRAGPLLALRGRTIDAGPPGCDCAATSIWSVVPTTTDGVRWPWPGGHGRHLDSAGGDRQLGHAIVIGLPAGTVIRGARTVSPRLVVHAVGVPGSRARRLACERVEPGAEAVGLRRGRIAVALRCCSARARR